MLYFSFNFELSRCFVSLIAQDLFQHNPSYVKIKKVDDKYTNPYFCSQTYPLYRKMEMNYYIIIQINTYFTIFHKSKSQSLSSTVTIYQ